MSSMPAFGTTTLCSPRQGTLMPLCLSFPRQETQCTTHGAHPPCLGQDLLACNPAAVQSPAIQCSSQHAFNQEASAKDLGQHFREKWGHLWHKIGVELQGSWHSWGPGCPCCRCSPSRKSHLSFCPPRAQGILKSWVLLQTSQQSLIFSKICLRSL